MTWPRAVASLSGVAVVLVMATAGCSGGGDEAAPEQEVVALSIQVSSPAFADGATILTEYTCDGEDASPPLRWSGAPEGTESIALVADDPDAPGGTWVHWVRYAIPPDVTELAGGSPDDALLSNGARHGTNDFKRLGYGGPCPPRGSPHRYFFKVYALDIEVGLAPGATKKELLRSMEGHILAQGRLTGTYQRS